MSGGGVPPLGPGLYLVATPIGNARDITLRALDILRAADVLAAEDTRSLRRLMEIHGIPLGGRRVVAYHDHNGPRVRPALIAAIAGGQSVAYASEAGTPAISDPGFALAREVAAAGLPLTSAPGPSAVITALTLAGLPTDRFLFAGFPPHGDTARRTFLTELAAVPATLVFYESPKRIRETLAALCEICGGERRAALCRELTKRFEEIMRGTLAELLDRTTAAEPRGEIVLLVERSLAAPAIDLEAEVARALRTMSVRDAADAVAAAHGIPRRDAYKTALRLAGRR